MKKTTLILTLLVTSLLCQEIDNEKRNKNITNYNKYNNIKQKIKTKEQLIIQQSIDEDLFNQWKTTSSTK